MRKPIQVLLQTTIPMNEDDWHVGRFSLLQKHLSEFKDKVGEPVFKVTARNREPGEAGDDPVLSHLADSDFDELWLFAVDTGDGLSENDMAGIQAFRKRGGGLMTSRDHQDLGSCLCGLGEVGRAHFFHSKNQEPEDRWSLDDTLNSAISWPNYHSGDNGDYQSITLADAVHPLLFKPDGSHIHYFPAHPHEGNVGVPPNTHARVIASGTSQTTHRLFNLAVAFDPEDGSSPAIAESSFHHFADYNWDPDYGAPSFVTEPAADGYKEHPELLDDIKTYVSNAALWLSTARR